MDSSEVAPEAKRTKLSSAAAHGAISRGEDRISALGDDVLLQILGLVADTDARNVLRTGALSRRWRGLWTRVPALRFDSWPTSTYGGSAERFVVSVDAALTLRARSGVAVERLAISFSVAMFPDHELHAPLSILASERWVRYALQHGVKSFHFELSLPCGKKWPTMDLVDLPSSSKLETLRLVVDGASVRLPATAVFPSLTDLTLENMDIALDTGPIFARFLSPACCPHLQNLRMRNIELGRRGLSPRLLIEANNLSELSLVDLGKILWLQLRTPGLRFLRVKECHALHTLTVMAPRLSLFTSVRIPSLTYMDGDLSCVSAIKVDLSSHVDIEYDEDDDAEYVNDGSALVLQHFSLAKCLKVDLKIPMRKHDDAGIIKDMMLPQLGHVTSLKVSISGPYEQHSLGDGVASLLTFFKNLTYLSLGFKKDNDRMTRPGSFKCGHIDHWKSQEISLSNVHEAKFKRLTGTDCELRFLRFMLSSATQLRKDRTPISTVLTSDVGLSRDDLVAVRMESSEVAGAAEAKRTKLSPVAAHGAISRGDDLISALGDDVLLQILRLVRDATAVVRTGALSRRWRGFWTRAPTLRFTTRRWLKYGGSAERFVAFVDDAIALRARSGVAVDRLAIRFHVESSRGHELVVPQSIRASERWIWHALQHGVKSFRFALTLKPWAKTWPTIDLAHLPSSSKLQTLRLVVDGTRVWLPTTVVFPSLTDLTLESMRLADDRDGRILAAFLSPACCPRLQKLRMRNVEFGSLYLPVLIEASNLSELSLVNLGEMISLELRTPGLRVLCIKDCPELDTLTVIVAPRLDINVDLSSHVEMEDGEESAESVNDGAVLLLQRCSLAKSLEVDLYVPMRNETGVDIIKDRLPQLRHVTSLKVSVSSPCWRHSFVDGLASLLTIFKNLTYLSLVFKNDGIWSRPGNYNCGHLDD
ncbi:hypothetical protein EJB05_03836, partial [Eragrostis curvula]